MTTNESAADSSAVDDCPDCHEELACWYHWRAARTDMEPLFEDAKAVKKHDGRPFGPIPMDELDVDPEPFEAISAADVDVRL